MKKIMMMAVAFALSAGAFAQTEVISGDFDNDGQISVGDVSHLVSTALGEKAMVKIQSCNCSGGDAGAVVGIWKCGDEELYLNEDGTTNYPDVVSYQYLPQRGLILFLDGQGNPAVFATVLISEEERLSLGFNDGTIKNYVVKTESDGEFQYVNLGLPDGTLWATFNVGATKPEEYGDYYAWGETMPHSNNTYDWGNYTLCDGTNTSLNRYCNNSAFGVVDNKTVLSLKDDVASKNWGGDWSMPTQKEFSTLFDSKYTESQWTTLNGVYGMKVTSIVDGYKGNSIFLPAAGWREGTDLRDQDTNNGTGCYWTTTLDVTYNYNAYYYMFHRAAKAPYKKFRSYGMTIRPVIPKYN